METPCEYRMPLASSVDFAYAQSGLEKIPIHGTLKHAIALIQSKSLVSRKIIGGTV
jgi:hypothetical protein